MLDFKDKSKNKNYYNLFLDDYIKKHNDWGNIVLKFKNNFIIFYYPNEKKKTAYLEHYCKDGRFRMIYGYKTKSDGCSYCNKLVSKSILTYVKLLQLKEKIK